MTNQDCKPNVVVRDNKLFYIDANNNCIPLNITINGNTGPRGPKGASGGTFAAEITQIA